MKKRKVFIDNIYVNLYNIKQCTNFSTSTIFNLKKNKPLNIDHANRIGQGKGGKAVKAVKAATGAEEAAEASTGGGRCRRNELRQKYGKFEENKRVTKLCQELDQNIKKMEYNHYERNLTYGLSIAENSIELSQLINRISKNILFVNSNHVRSIYVKLIDKILKIYDNIPIRSVSLILNSMLKLNYYHREFIFLFFKNIKRVINRSNYIDLCILYHFYVNSFDKIHPFNIPNDQVLNSFLTKISHTTSSLQIHGISCILRCNKKIVKRMLSSFTKNNRESRDYLMKDLEDNTVDVSSVYLWVKKSGREPDEGKEEDEKELDEAEDDDNDASNYTHNDEVRGGKGGNNWKHKKISALNLRLIERINVSLRDNFYLKLSYANIQQLCNMLEDFEFFNLVDNNCYYDVLNILKRVQNLDKFKNLDYINILNIIKSRNIKYNDALSFSHFSFLFEAIKDKNVEDFSSNDLAELMKILYYFKKMYHLKFCLNKLEYSLHKKNLSEVSSVSTLIYLLYEYSIIGKSSDVMGSLQRRLFDTIMSRECSGSSNGSDNTGCSDLNDGGSTSYNDIPINERILLVKSIEGLIDKGTINLEYLRKREFYISNCNENPFKESNVERYIHYILYKILVLGRVKYNDFSIFLYLLKYALLFSLHFTIKDVVLLLKGLHLCSYFITKDNYFIFEKALNYFSIFLMPQYHSHYKRNKSNAVKNDLMKYAINECKDNFFKYEPPRNVHCLNHISSVYRQMEDIIQVYCAYLHNEEDGRYQEKEVDLIDEVSDNNILKKNSTYYNDQDKYNSIMNYSFIKICIVDCCNILYYFRKLNYVNHDVINVILKNVYGNINFLKNKHILKMISGFSIIKNIDEYFSSFNSIFKKILFQFFLSHKESDENNTVKVDETIKLFYLVSKLRIDKESINYYIRKYILIYLENLLEKNELTVNNLQLLFGGFKYMYPYRYIGLIEYSLKRIHQMVYDERSGSYNRGDDNVRGDNLESHMNCSKRYIVGGNTKRRKTKCAFSISFLKIYFSSLPILVNPSLNIYSNVNKLYINISHKLFEQLSYELTEADEAFKKDIIHAVIDFVNLSFPFIPFFEKYTNLILYILDVNEILSKDQLCMFLLNLKFFSKKFLTSQNFTTSDLSKHNELKKKIDDLLKTFSSNNEDAVLCWKNMYPEEENVQRIICGNNDRLSYDFSFNKRKIVLFDTENDNEKEIISREYNYIDLNDLYKTKKDDTKRRKTVCDADKDQNEDINIDMNECSAKKRQNYKSDRNALNEFEIILKKYAYCQNNEKDKLNISKNFKVFLFDIKYVDLKKKIIFEFLDQQCYFKEPDNSSIELLPLIYLRLLFLKKLNFHILLMPFYEWNNCHGRLEKVKAIFQKLLNITNDADNYLYQTDKAHIFSSVGRYE
ncbi:RAP protein, putative [Plasmodium malariae]|uniref:RAP protein, putative n=2 Tax=Plasmodium (Plasmodium) TaxID=418103 RepID=A0A1A8W718_PLAMA|nr:RAP protein, putative [Plasmodium malariae]SBS87477.1 hypothetical protein PMALA_019690 [Plasmodium malariae]SCO93327.1 RAP protein, putative [Plasmodium malariae]